MERLFFYLIELRSILLPKVVPLYLDIVGKM